MTSSGATGRPGRCRISALPSALACRGILGDLWRGRALAVFLDYDGTLAPIVPAPTTATRRTVRPGPASVGIGAGIGEAGRGAPDITCREVFPDTACRAVPLAAMGVGAFGALGLSRLFRSSR